MKNVIKIVAITLAVGFLVNTYSSCTLSRKLKEAETAYKFLRQELGETHKFYQKQQKQLVKEREKLEEEIAQSDNMLSEVSASNRVLQAKWMSERKQKVSTIAQAARREEIAANLIDGLSEEVAGLKLEINSYKKLTDGLKLELNIWKKMYEDELRLRKACEKLYSQVKIAHSSQRIGFGLFAGIGIGIDGEPHVNVGFGLTWRF